MLYVDTKSWLPDDLLIKADKITMGNSLELRVPLLDHTVLEFAARLPSNYKVRGLETKRVLKRAFQGVVPQEILDRKKTGFPVPYERWLRKELRSFVRETVCSARAMARGYFQANAVKKLIEVDSDRGWLLKGGLLPSDAGIVAPALCGRSPHRGEPSGHRIDCGA